jgi:hypothetical protein
MILAAGQPMVPEEARALLIAGAITVPVAILLVLSIRWSFPKTARAWGEFTQRAQWPLYAMGAGLFFSVGAFAWHSGEPFTWVSCLAFGCLESVAMIDSIYRHRAQWGIKGLLVITLIVAICCSLLATVGWPMVPVLAGLFGTAFVLQCLAVVFSSWLKWPRYPPEDDHDTTPR